MRILIVYDSRTGTTRQAAEEMASIARGADHECRVASIRDIPADEVSDYDAVCVGSWTQGLFFVLQHPTKASLRFIDSIPPLYGKPAAVFCTYKTSPGGLLTTLAARLSARGASVTGRFKSRGASAPDGFLSWVQELPAATPGAAVEVA
ncbi:MAG: flavodoxin family protein [Phycisphaerales bacterium]